MPWIQKNKKQERPKQRNENTDMRVLRQKAYQNTSWRKLRDTYMKEHPVCEECLKKGKITAAEDIHHKISPFKNNDINYSLLLDDKNLMALCKTCHGNIHGRKNETTAEELLEIIEELLKDIE